MKLQTCVVSAFSIGLAAFCNGDLTTALAAGASDDWPHYGHDPGGMRYSPLAQIDRTNVSQLRIAWVFHTGDISDGKHGAKRSGFETTPLVVDGTMYLTTPFNRVIALNPETGAQKWAYDPKIEMKWDYGDGLINRGVAIWTAPSPDPKAGGERIASAGSRRRIFEATLDARLIAIDAATGRLCKDFGHRGEVSLRDVPRFTRGRYHMTSPPTVIDDVVVVGSAIDDNTKAEMPSGVVRAYDVHSGKLRWKWEPLVSPTGKDRREPWRTGAGNAWSIITADPERHLLFVPTGSASPDYFGGLRPGDNRWANSVVALRAATGELAWGFQLVHHDLWDYDTAAAPLLGTIEREGKKQQVVVAGNKTGMLYVLDRDTGSPVFPVEERPVPHSDVPDEFASPTQPFPSAPPSLVPHSFSLDEIWALNDSERELCRKQVEGLRNEGVFTPPSLQGSVVVPGNVGGMNWSGYAFDPSRNLLFVNVNSLAAMVKLIPRGSPVKDRGEYAEQAGTPYGMVRHFLQGPSGLPFCAPPWGTLAAVDLSAGKIRWQTALGSFASFAPGKTGIPQGSVSLGGPIVTAGGLVFLAGTIDPFIRAFDVETGTELWKAQLPASGAATPMTYSVRGTGKQYVVIAAGGHSKVTEEPQSDALVAFALP